MKIDTPDNSRLADPQFLLEQYKILSDRRTNHNSLLWETPAMFFTAQAFLYNIALGSSDNFPWWSRAIAAFVSFVFSVLMGLLFENHRAMEISDAEQMLNIENYLIKNCNQIGLVIHTTPDKRNYLNIQDDSKSSLVRDTLLYRKKITKRNFIPSFDIWKYGFRFTAYISAFVFLFIICKQIPSVSLFFQRINMSVKITMFLSCVLDTIVLLCFKAFIPVDKKFNKELCCVFIISIALIDFQNRLLFGFLNQTNAKPLTCQFSFVAANFVALLLFVSYMKYAKHLIDKLREEIKRCKEEKANTLK